MTDTTRRLFLSQAVAIAAATASPVLFTSATGAEIHVDDDLSRMRWLNEPASWHRTADGVQAVSRPKTDFWRTTFYGYVTDNGHFFHQELGGDFVFEAQVSGAYAAQYDQAGLMVRLDAENWVKCGAEFVDGAEQGSVVFTRGFSDWSSLRTLTRTGPVWWRVVRKRDSLEVLFSLDGRDYTSARLGYLRPADSAQVGVMCAAPEGTGFESTFRYLKLSI
jgi:uncharacterized protein